MPRVLQITFTDSSGASMSRSAGPDLANLSNPALWDQRVKDALTALYEERHGEAPANLGAAVSSLAERWFIWLRGEEQRLRQEAAIEAAKTAEDTQIPDE